MDLRRPSVGRREARTRRDAKTGILKVGYWEVAVDRRQTEGVYGAVNPDRCSCLGCRNFWTVETPFPAPFVRSLKAMGVDPAKPAEVHEWGPGGGGQVTYGGWFHALGRLISGPRFMGDPARQGDTPPFPQWKELASGFKIWLDDHAVQFFPVFGTRSLIRIQFLTERPWLLAEPHD